MLRKVKNLIFHRGRKSDPAAADRALARAEAQRHVRDVRDARTRQDAQAPAFQVGGGGAF